ncbi:MAG: hypothetical protein V4773_28800 [Verrucomicrobiota bacterium]
MKTPFRSVLLLAMFFSTLLACVLFAVSDVRAAEPVSGAVLGSAAVDTAAAVAQPFIVSFAESHPWVLTLLAVIATLRLVFKPLMSAVHVYVQSTAGESDDAFLDKVEHSRAYKILAWLLDYFGSIKVGPQKPQVQSASSAE